MRTLEHLAERPRWRGWLHLWAFAVSIATGTVLVALADGTTARAATAVYAVTVSLLFGTSALYHRVRWGRRMHAVMMRLDHSMIFVFIAGTYTPFSLVVLPRHLAWTVLSVVWGGAAVGIGMRMLWLRASRWLYVPLYLALGWVAVFVLPQLLSRAGLGAVILLFIGGVIYTAGGAIYAARRPDPLPKVFGYHEVFHACTLAAAACHYAAVWLALY